MSTDQNNQQRYNKNGVDGSTTVELEQLSRRYAAFRREHRARMRIPEALREATLEAIGKGLPEKTVRVACRISPEQLKRWREIRGFRGRGKEGRKAGEKAKARVFKVSDDAVEKKSVHSRKEGPSEALQLRIGGWEISFRHIER